MNDECTHAIGVDSPYFTSVWRMRSGGAMAKIIVLFLTALVIVGCSIYFRQPAVLVMEVALLPAVAWLIYGFARGLEYIVGIDDRGVHACGRTMRWSSVEKVSATWISRGDHSAVQLFALGDAPFGGLALHSADGLPPAEYDRLILILRHRIGPQQPHVEFGGVREPIGMD